ncbi:MAG: DUF433 domain-containing protein [Chloroflexi bacterium]|nr:DUF433 domain-containing protein [Chloroflexota bacterium]MBI5080156.1 DUF433 domain-containing protein [Chloroflexota bacterium]MBI5712368.1 DUF433 domain-containing protein [Chloroflexota bacterium]
MFVETRYEHVALNDQGAPIIVGTTMKVKELAAERLAWGWSPEELLINHSYLSLGQIFSALAYYSDHQEEMDREIEADAKFVSELRRKAKPSPHSKKFLITPQ